MKNDKRWNREMKRYRIIEHELRGESVFTVEWNDRWFVGIWGRWHDIFHTKSLEQASKKIHRLDKYKLKK